MRKPKGKRKMQVFLIYFVAGIFFFFEKLVMLYILQFQIIMILIQVRWSMILENANREQMIKNNLFYYFVRLKNIYIQTHSYIMGFCSQCRYTACVPSIIISNEKGHNYRPGSNLLSCQCTDHLWLEANKMPYKFHGQSFQNTNLKIFNINTWYINVTYQCYFSSPQNSCPEFPLRGPEMTLKSASYT